jgi:hypothetical protein
MLAIALDTSTGNVQLCTRNGSTIWDQISGGGGGGGGISGVNVLDEGTLQGSVTAFNFVGAGVTASVAGSAAAITVPGSAGDPVCQIFSGAGKTTVVDGDFSSTPSNGTLAIAVNTTDNTKRLGARVGGAWVHVQLS